MTPSKGSRGRPKGTGLNDAAQLRAIANLIAADPDLRPTTAIKKLGINDPSIIRRLRDKFHAVEAQLIAELAASVAVPVRAPSAIDNRAVANDHLGARVVALSSARETRKSQPVAPAASAVAADAAAPVTAPAVTATIQSLPSARARRPSAIPPPSETDLPSWIGAGLSLYVLSVEAQFAVAGAMFQWPPVAAILQSQVAFTDLAITLTNRVMTSASST
jgi:hypothetical protein